MRSTTGLMAAMLAASAQAEAEPVTVCLRQVEVKFSDYTIVEFEYTTLSSHEYAVLKENQADGGWVPVCTFLPNGGIETYHARLPAEVRDV